MKETIWHPFTQHGIAGPAVEVSRAEGVYLYTKDGRKIIDAISSWWVNTHGHCHPEIVKTVQEQAAKLEQVIFAGFTHEPAEELSENLLSFTNFDHSHVFFSDSGSTAVEVALKMAVGFWAHSGKPRRKIVALEGGYHGDTFGAMSAGGRSVFNKLYEPYLFEVTHLPFDDMANAFEKILRKEGDDVGALIVEPLIQGAGGMRMYSAETLKNLAVLCKKYEVLLIADEVMTGFGRTGTKFACEQAGVVPDILCLSKGLTGGFLPMGATLCSSEIYNAFYSKNRSKMFFHSSSYTGNVLSCAAALASLRVWEKEPVMERIAAIGKAHESAITRLEKRGAENIRQKGIILALDVTHPPIPSPQRGEGLREGGQLQAQSESYLSALSPRLYDFFLERDILLRPLGHTVYIMPPYCITQEELERIYDVIGLALEHFRDGAKQQAA